MTPQDREKVSELFEAALEMEPAGREAFLSGTGASNEVLEEVRSLLAAHEEVSGSDFMKDPAAGPPASPATGESVLLKLSERYEILGEIGIGGMSRVYRARDRSTEEIVAVKVLNSAVSPDAVERFKNELRLARKITHKNVCRIYELHPVDSTAYISMELVQGESLNEILSRFGGLPLTKGIEVALQICDGLEEAHRQGVIHRDLKPGNIMIDREGNAKVMDFGIALSIESRATDGSFVAGTPRYMAPEQLEGRVVDVRTDIYALGLILGEVFSGAPDPSIPGSLKSVIRRCQEKDPGDRYASVGELRSELTGIPYSPDAASSGTRMTRRAALGGGVAVLCMGAGFLARGCGSPESDRRLPLGPMHHDPGPVWDLAYTRDGRLLASAGEDTQVRLWDPRTKTDKGTLSTHTGAVASLGFSTAGELVSGDSFGSVRIWNTEAREEMEALNDHSEVIEAVAFAPDGGMIAFGSSDNSVKLWDVRAGRLLRSLVGHRAEIRSVAFSPKGPLLASCGKDKTLRIWDARTGEARPPLTGHGDWIEKVTFSPLTGRWVATGGYDDRVIVWEVGTDDHWPPLLGHEMDVISLCFSPDERWLASASDDGAARIWNLRTRQVSKTIAAGRGPVKAVAFNPKFSADAYQLALGFSDGTIEIQEVRLSA